MRRRQVLALLALTAACGGPARGVRVAVVWSGWELTQFRRVLSRFPGGDTWSVSVQSAGNDLNTLIRNQVARTAAPDVALVQQPSMVRANPELFAPLDPVPGIPPDWAGLLVSGGRSHGTWFKAAHKSLVWYRPDRMPGEPPRDWDAWVAMCRAMAARGRPPLAVGAADGWALTDWFENVLLSIDPVTYQRLAAGAPLWGHASVLEALRRIGTIWSIPGAFPGGPRRALVTQFDGALVEVFRHGRAAMAPGADFYYPIIERYGSSPARWFRFPAVDRPPLIVAGDAAVLLNPGSAGGHSLIRWLADPRAGDIWARAGGFLSVNPAVTGYPGDLATLAAEIRERPVFDLSDQLGGRLAGADGRGTWQIFQDFFTEVAVHRTPPAAAARRTSAVLSAEQRARPA